jgi:hypothetical protein
VAELNDRFVGRVVQTLDTGGDHVGFVLEPVWMELGGPDAPSFRLGQADDIDAGHPA